MLTRILPLLPAALIFLFFSQSATGEESSPKIRSDESYSFSYTPLYQFNTNLNEGGNFDVNRHFFRFKTFATLNRKTSIGLGLGYDLESWNLKDVLSVAGASPWDIIHRPSLSFPLLYRFDNKFRIGITPTMEFSGASGADFGDGIMYGATVMLLYPVNTKLTLGLGFGAFDRLEETSLFPYIIVDWRINEQLRITNPFRAGPAGPAGLEVVYSPSEQWKLGLGGAYRSYRFRLSEDNSIQSGIGQNNLITAFARIQRRFGEMLTLDLAGGLLFNGQLSIEDREGRVLQSADYDNAPFVALTFAGKF